MHKISLISVFYNRDKYVRESVESAMTQKFLDYEIILVDDGSTDGTLQALREFGSDARVKIRAHSNRGFVTAISQAVDSARGEYIAVHGSGDLSHPDRLYKQAAALDSDPAVGVVGCLVRNVHLYGDGATAVRGKAFSGDARAELLRSNLFTHGEVMFRRSLYEHVGGYRRFFRFAQDLDLWCRMSLHTRFLVLPEVLYTRKLLPDGASVDPEKRLLQRYLADFALQCHRSRLAGNEDLLEMYGEHAPFFRDRSTTLAREFGERALLHLSNVQHTAAQRYADAGVREEATLLGMLVLALTRAPPRIGVLIASQLKQLRRAVRNPYVGR